MPTQLHGVGRQALLLEAQDIEVQPGREGESLAPLYLDAQRAAADCPAAVGTEAAFDLCHVPARVAAPQA